MMKKCITMAILLALAINMLCLVSCEINRKELGEGPLTCYIEGELLTDKFGDEVVFWDEGTQLMEFRDDRSYRVKAIDGKFYMTINSDHVTKYRIATGDLHLSCTFLTEDNAHIKVQILEDKIMLKSDGEEARKHEVLDSILTEQFWKSYGVLAAQLYDSTRQKEFFKAEYLRAQEENAKLYKENKKLAPEVEDSIKNLMDYYMNNPYEKYTAAGLKIQQQLDSINNEKERFCINYYAEHPMLWALFDVLDAARWIHDNSTSPGYFSDDMLKQFESYLKLYDDTLSATYPGHPVHGQIAEANLLCPGQHYFDYDIHTADGDALPISSLIKGKVALIDFWASWCGACRVHSKALIPVYEKYKDKGFTIVAIAREKNRRAMEKAMKKDGYPWTSYLEPMNDENRVWSNHGLRGGGGGMVLIDRDGTILSTSTDAKVLEPYIQKALNIK